jgi:hypothetical protein
MFPDWLQTFFQNSSQYSKSIGHLMKKTIWFCSSSFLVLLLPILVQLEFSQVAEMQAAQTRQVDSDNKNILYFILLSDSSWTISPNWIKSNVDNV